jgi:deoxyribodipyrimidine photo-lyase
LKGSGRQQPAIVWFRNDLRLEDNLALLAASRRGRPVIPLFVWAPDEEDWAPGAASRWWLHQSLAGFDRQLRKLGSRLTIRTGPSLAALQSLCAETGADAVFWNRRYEPAVFERDAQVAEAVQGRIEANSFPGYLLHEPGSILTKTGAPYQVFTPFWKACQALPEPANPQPAPVRVPAPKGWPDTVRLADLELEPRIDWASGFRAAWQPGSQGAAAALEEFVSRGAAAYAEARDRPGRTGTSGLSPHLHFGEVSPRQVWHAVSGRSRRGRPNHAPKANEGGAYLRQLGWREFAYHLLFHFPHTVQRPLSPEFERFPWKANARALRAWRQGLTGYPIVDAGMRELWTTGWMHNRARMIAASFLVKDLLIPWQQGAEWFWDTLVDADLANNTLGWQWTAGCGADAAPFFRIFNPVLQGRRYDPHGTYVRRWVREINHLPDRWIHEPWNAPAEVLASAGVRLGKDYPMPVVDHSEARKRALQAYWRLK